MRLEAGLRTRQEQRLQLLPQMLQAIEILQLSTLDLCALVERELGENETLELAEPGPEAGATVEPAAGSEPTEAAAETEHWYEDEAPKPRASDDDFDPLLLVPAEPERSLQAWLLAQVAMLDLDEALRDLVGFLIGSLDANGHLELGLERLCELYGDEDLVRDTLDLLRSLDPAGVGQAGPIESMVAQIDPRDPDADLLEDLVRGQLETLARNQYPKAAKALGLEVAELKLLLPKLRRLDPCPGKRFATREAEILRPDVVVRREDGEWRVYVDEAAVPPLRIRGDYARLAKDRKAPPETRSYLRGKLGSARELMAALAQRRETLGRVARAIFDRQRGFLERGPAGLEPLGMQEVADAVGVHLSTVSRAIAHKQVQTDFGIYQLRSFFDGGKPVGAGVGGGGESRESIKERIRKLIEAEDKAAPRSDEELVHDLAGQGLEVARRTVAKYRKELGYPSSWRRRAY